MTQEQDNRALAEAIARKWLPDMETPSLSAREVSLRSAIREGIEAALSRAPADDRDARIERLEQENARLREALTPSGDTKAAYIGEFQINVEYADEDGCSYWQPQLVDWTTIKEIMAAIRGRATQDQQP